MIRKTSWKKYIECISIKQIYLQFCCPIAGAIGYFMMGIEWLKKTTKTEGKRIIITRSSILCQLKCWPVYLLNKLCNSSSLLVLECDNGEHRTHAFDINGAFSAYLSIILFILYSIDVFIKHKELKEIKCPDETPDTSVGEWGHCIVKSQSSLYIL